MTSSFIKKLAIALCMFVFVAACPILTNAAETKCVNPDENQNLFTSAAKGDQAALVTLQEKSTAGDFCAKYSLGAAYSIRKKIEGKKLMDEAFVESQAAAEKGDADAQAFLGTYYFYQGTEKDKAKAIELLRKAADQENKEAMFELGRLYDGLGQFYYRTGWTDKDPAVAADWYMKSAEKGYHPSYLFLADMYAKGEGVPQNWHNAYFWGCLATECFVTEPPPWEAALCMHCAPSRIYADPLVAKEHLSNSEIEAIKKKASEWKSGTPPPIEKPGFLQKIRCRFQTPC